MCSDTKLQATELDKGHTYEDYETVILESGFAYRRGMRYNEIGGVINVYVPNVELRDKGITGHVTVFWQRNKPILVSYEVAQNGKGIWGKDQTLTPTELKEAIKF